MFTYLILGIILFHDLLLFVYLLALTISMNSIFSINGIHRLTYSRVPEARPLASPEHPRCRHSFFVWAAPGSENFRMAPNGLCSMLDNSWFMLRGSVLMARGLRLMADGHCSGLMARGSFLMAHGSWTRKKRRAAMRHQP